MSYPGRTVRTEAGKHRLHDLLATYITANACLQTGIVFRAGGNLDWPPGTYASFESTMFDAELRVPLGGVVENLIAKIDPVTIEIGFREKSWSYGTSEPGKTTVSNTLDIQTKLIVPFFVEYYENWVPWLRSNVNPHHANWPNVWQFGRIARNAASHNRVTINDPNFKPVTWYSHTYGPAQHGHALFGAALPMADVFVLLVEMNDALDGLGCPT